MLTLFLLFIIFLFGVMVVGGLIAIDVAIFSTILQHLPAVIGILIIIFILILLF